VSDDPPTDAIAVLSQLFEETRTAIAEGDLATARDTIASAETVATNKLPAGDRRETFLHGCGRVLELLDPEDGDPETDVAAAYITAMERRLPDE